jgi:acetyl-CoA carboxylase carboxyl transferase subunit alpha
MALTYTLEFEKPLQQIETQIAELERGAAASGRDLAGDIADLRKTHRDLLGKIYADLRPWDTVRVARHPERPQFRDYVRLLCKDFCELHGDRRFKDDPAIVTGLGRIGSIKCLLVGHHKGATRRRSSRATSGARTPRATARRWRR